MDDTQLGEKPVTQTPSKPSRRPRHASSPAHSETPFKRRRSHSSLPKPVSESNARPKGPSKHAPPSKPGPRKRSNSLSSRDSSAASSAVFENGSFLPRLSRMFDPRLQPPSNSQKKTRTDRRPVRRESFSRMQNSFNVPKNTDPRSRRLSKSSSGRPYGLMSPSVISMLSEFTSSTNTSEGSSDTTITQKSYAVSSNSRVSRSSKRKEKSREGTRGKEWIESAKRNDSTETLDVFRFLQKEPDHSLPVTESHSDPNLAEEQQKEAASTHKRSKSLGSSRLERSGLASPPREPVQLEQVHSDSGISIRSSSPEVLHKHAGRPKRKAEMRADEKDSGDMDDLSELDFESSSDSDFDENFDPGFANGHLGMSHRLPLSNDEPQPPSGMHTPENTRPDLEHLLKNGIATPPKVLATDQGFDSSCAVAQKGTAPSKRVTPLYRRFGNLNQEILLHLQDELTELERQLKGLDENIAKSSKMVHDAASPSEWNYHRYLLGQFTFQRTELLGRIYMKKEQHHQALTWLKSSCNDFDRPLGEEIKRNQTWLKSQTQTSRADSLQHEDDLIKVPMCGEHVPPTSVMRAALFGPVIAYLLTVIAFAATSTRTGRVFWLFFTVAASLAVLHRADFGVQFSLFERYAFSAAYIGVVTVTAAAFW